MSFLAKMIGLLPFSVLTINVGKTFHEITRNLKTIYNEDF